MGSGRSTRASPSRPRRRSMSTSRSIAWSAGDPDDRERRASPCHMPGATSRARGGPMPLNEAVHWSRDLGGRVRVALVQAGTFRSDAGALFGPVPRVLWDRLTTEEIDAEHRLLQALNCLLIETPAGRVLVETGIGERFDEKVARIRQVAGEPILP